MKDFRELKESLKEGDRVRIVFGNNFSDFRVKKENGKMFIIELDVADDDEIEGTEEDLEEVEKFFNDGFITSIEI
jgi:hypothetical protein